MAAINKVRSSRGVGKVTYNMTIAKLAAVRSKEVSTNFSHSRAGGKSSYSVYSDYGVTKPKAVGETIGYATRFDGPEDMIDYWMTSSGHASIIVNGKYSQFGMAEYKASDGKTYIVAMFAS